MAVYPALLTKSSPTDRRTDRPTDPFIDNIDKSGGRGDQTGRVNSWGSGRSLFALYTLSFISFSYVQSKCCERMLNSRKNLPLHSLIPRDAAT